MNFDINFDFQRRDRLGLIEAIWGQDKNIDQLERLSENVLSKNEVVFITRINSEKANYLLDLYDDARFYEEANCLTGVRTPAMTGVGILILKSEVAS